MDELGAQVWENALPVFPLPSCVLLPGGLLPLHIFEPRYRRMMLDLLARDESDRHLAMALLREGYEPLYHTNRALVHPVVCVGTVMQHEQLNDGRFNLILLGRTRAVIRLEDHTGTYRQAVLAAAEGGVVPEPDECNAARHDLRSLLDEAARTGIVDPQAVEHVFQVRGSIEALVDIIAFYFIPTDAYVVKQRILAERDVRERIDIARRGLQLLLSRGRAARHAAQAHWPPPTSEN